MVRSKKTLKAIADNFGKPNVKQKIKPKEEPQKVYFYLTWFTSGYNVTGIRKEEDTSLAKLKKCWKEECDHDTTPIMEGVMFKRKD